MHDRWDQHSDLKAGHESNAHAVDQPIAALIRDLKRRGLLESTLVVWSAEFGRTPFAQGSPAATTIRSASRRGWRAAE